MTPPPPASATILAHEIHEKAPLARRASWGAQRAAAVRFIRFGIVGGLASIVYLGLFAVILSTGMHYLLAGAISYLAAIAMNFSINQRWTFARGVRSIPVQAASFLGVQLTLGAVNLSLLHILVISGIRPIILAQLLAAGALVPVNFLASQRWGFR